MLKQDQCIRVFVVVVLLCAFSTIYFMYSVEVVIKNKPTREDNKTTLPTMDSLANDVFDCSDMNQLEFKGVLSSGASRIAYAASYRGKEVAVKIGKKLDDNCVRLFIDNRHRNIKVLLYEVRTQCECSKSRQMLMEIIYHSIARSPYVVENLGFCITDKLISFRSANSLAWEFKLNFSNRSIISVYEYGQVVNMKKIGSIPLKDRLRMLRAMTLAMSTFENTIIGPIAMVDFRSRHIANVNGKWKMYDLGLFEFGALPCTLFRHNSLLRSYLGRHAWKIKEECPEGVPCPNGTCPSFIQNINGPILCGVFREILKRRFITQATSCLDLSVDYFLGYIGFLLRNTKN